MTRPLDTGRQGARRWALPVVASTLAAGLLAVQLLVPPVIGLANNGDFERVMGYVGFQYLTDVRAEKYFSWIVTKFSFGTPGWFRSGLLTSETLLAWIARLVSRPFAPDGLFDLRMLGSIHLLLLALGIGLLVRGASVLRPLAQWLMAGLLVFFFTDVGYAAPLNSFFSQAASLVFLILTLGVASRGIARGQASSPLLAWYFLFAALFVGSKPQESIQALLLAFFALRLGRARPAGFWRQPSVWGAATLCLFALWYFRQAPPEITEVAKYHKVFMEVLPNSTDQERDLSDLGLDPEWANHAGKTAYPPTSPFNDVAFRREFLDRFSYAKLMKFYIVQPSRLASTLVRGGAQAFRLRHPRFGNFEKGLGFPAGAKTGSFSVWSDARLTLPGHPLALISVLFLANLAAVIATYKRASLEGRLAREGIVLLIFMAGTAFSVCVLSNAHGDLARHFYVFHALCDLLLVADAGWIAQAVTGRARQHLGLVADDECQLAL